MVYADGDDGVTPGTDERNMSNGWKMFDGHGVQLSVCAMDLVRVKD